MAQKDTPVKPKTAKVTAPKAKIAKAEPKAAVASPSKTVKLTPAPSPVAAVPTPASTVQAKPAEPNPTPHQPAEIVEAGEVVKKPDFLDKAVMRSGVKRRDAKPAIEAALDEIAEILLRGDELNLPPLGKLKVVKSKDLGSGAKALTLKLRTMKDS